MSLKENDYVFDSFMEELNDINELSTEYDSEGNQLTKEQAEFFKNSKVRDNQGRLLVCYHGTYTDFDTFKLSDNGLYGAGVYFSFGSVRYNRNFKIFMKCYINLINPLYINDVDGAMTKYKTSGEEMSVSITKDGYDGIISSFNDWVIAYSSNQIKLIDNKTPTNSNRINENAFCSMGININDSKQPFTKQILNRKKTIETRDKNSLDPYVGKRVGIVKTGEGKAQLVGYADIDEPKVYHTKKEFDRDFKKHLVDKDSPYYIDKIKYGYPLSKVKKIKPRNVSTKGIIARKVKLYDESFEDELGESFDWVDEEDHSRVWISDSVYDVRDEIYKGIGRPHYSLKFVMDDKLEKYIKIDPYRYTHDEGIRIAVKNGCFADKGIDIDGDNWRDIEEYIEKGINSTPRTWFRICVLFDWKKSRESPFNAYSDIFGAADWYLGLAYIYDGFIIFTGRKGEFEKSELYKILPNPKKIINRDEDQEIEIKEYEREKEEREKEQKEKDEEEKKRFGITELDLNELSDYIDGLDKLSADELDQQLKDWNLTE